ncbi:MAG: triose-phosphate isomerase [Gemmatimonadota bacterium]|nr:triose-phosphate isomerase [Gemmatimonadota bacterium]
MRKRIFAANWKMNHGPTAAGAFIEQFRSRWTPGDSEVAFFPSALAFAAVRDAAGEPRHFKLGVQNVYAADRGAFTGENSAPIARDAGADYVLVGHSERRHVFGETDEMCAAKCAAVVRAQMTPMLCVGETLDQREAGHTSALVTAQLRAGLALLDAGQAEGVVIAYEPVWAIGTGRNATPADAAETHAVLRNALAELLGEKAGGVSILYGGSVTPKNVQDLLAASDVDGVLVGGASLEVDSWLSICSH